MSNVISIADRKPRLRAATESPTDAIEEKLALIGRQFIPALYSHQAEVAFFKAIKGILKSRSIKFRVTLEGISDDLNKRTTLLFPAEKCGFTLDTKASSKIGNDWIFHPLDTEKNPAENAGFIIDKLEEAKNERNRKRPTGCTGVLPAGRGNGQ